MITRRSLLRMLPAIAALPAVGPILEDGFTVGEVMRQVHTDAARSPICAPVEPVYDFFSPPVNGCFAFPPGTVIGSGDWVTVEWSEDWS